MKNPRLQVSLHPKTYDAIMRLGRITGQSASSVIRTILDPQTDVLNQIADTVEQARRLAAPLSYKMNLRLTEGERLITGCQDQARIALDQLHLDLSEERDRQNGKLSMRQGKGL